MAEEVLDAEEIEELEAGSEPDSETRALTSGGIRDLELLRNEGRTIAIAAAGGVVAGAATVAAVGVARAGARKVARRNKPSKRERAQQIVASRSFLIDVHVLGK